MSEDKENKVAAIWFTPPDQAKKPEAERTRYKVRGLQGTEVMDVTFVRDELADTMTMTSRGANACIKAGLLGWENGRDRSDREVEYKDNDWRANANAMPSAHLIDVVWYIWQISFVQPEQKKN